MVVTGQVDNQLNKTRMRIITAKQQREEENIVLEKLYIVATTVYDRYAESEQGTIRNVNKELKAIADDIFSADNVINYH